MKQRCNSLVIVSLLLLWLFGSCSQARYIPISENMDSLAIVLGAEEGHYIILNPGTTNDTALLDKYYEHNAVCSYDAIGYWTIIRDTIILTPQYRLCYRVDLNPCYHGEFFPFHEILDVRKFVCKQDSLFELSNEGQVSLSEAVCSHVVKSYSIRKNKEVMYRLLHLGME